MAQVDAMFPIGPTSARTRRSSCRNGVCYMFLSLCFMTLVRKAEKRRPIRGVFFWQRYSVSDKDIEKQDQASESKIPQKAG